MRSTGAAIPTGCSDNHAASRKHSPAARSSAHRFTGCRLYIPTDDLDARRLIGLAAAAPLVKANFNPDEPRDDHGRWTDANGGGPDAATESEGASDLLLRPASEITFGHHVADPEAVETAIRNALSGVRLLPGFNSGGVNVGGTWYIYRAFVLPDGRKGRFYTNVAHKPMADLGYSVGAWNGLDGALAASFRVDAGDYSTNRVLPNTVDINMRHSSTENADLLRFEKLKPAWLAVVAAWEPDCTNVVCWDYWRHVFGSRKTYPPFRSG